MQQPIIPKPSGDKRYQDQGHITDPQTCFVLALAHMCRWQVGGSGTLSVLRVQDIGGLLFFIMLFMAFSSLFAALFTFPSEFQVRLWAGRSCSILGVGWSPQLIG